MDRFGYARIVDVAVYERNKEAADSENKYIVHCMNTGKICIFTNSGKMHQVKVIDLPYGKFRDKGVPIDNVSNYSSSDEQIVSVYDSEQMRFAMLLFSTAQGMVKKSAEVNFRWQNEQFWLQNFRKKILWSMFGLLMKISMSFFRQRTGTF